MSRAFLTLIVVAVLAACSSPAADEQPSDAAAPPPAHCSDTVELRLVAVDPWGRPLDGADFSIVDLARRPHEPPVPLSCGGASPPAQACLKSAAVEVELFASNYRPLKAYVSAGEGGGQPAVDLEGDGYYALATATDGDDCPVQYLFLAPEHRWFATSGRGPSRNLATFYLCGETLYQDLAEELAVATRSIAAATWWWQSDFELVRPLGEHPSMSPEERLENTILTRLDAHPDLPIRVMVGRFAAETATGMAFLNTDKELRGKAYDTTDLFEVLLQGNPTPVPLFDPFVPVPHTFALADRVRQASPAYADLDFADDVGTAALALEQAEAASWHQKCWTIDDRVAFISGMNVKSTDWDTPDHGVFEARRMKFLSTAEERAAVEEHAAFPDLGPRKDAGVRLVGPAATDVAEILQARWEYGRSHGDLFAELTTPWPPPERAAEVPEGVMAQVVATMPEPFGERSILEVHEKAYRNAEDFIFIEDQYFRVPLLLPALGEALAAHPGLHVVVVTKPVSPLDGAKKWTLYMDQELRKMAGGRYLLLELKSFDPEGLADGTTGPLFQPVDVHTKVSFVDDLWLTVGSANKNNRGLLYEGELNAVVLDQAFVRNARRAILANLTGDPATAWETLSGQEILARLEQQADVNAALEKAWLAGKTADPPTGFVYPLVLTPDYYVDVGPDAF